MEIDIIDYLPNTIAAPNVYDDEDDRETICDEEPIEICEEDEDSTENCE
jgi:hypothetical protein